VGAALAELAEDALRKGMASISTLLCSKPCEAGCDDDVTNGLARESEAPALLARIGASRTQRSTPVSQLTAALIEMLTTIWGLRRDESDQANCSAADL